MFPLLFSLKVSFAGDPLIERSLAIIDERYLWPEDLVAQTAFVMAVQEAENRLPWLIVDENPEAKTLTLLHGTQGVIHSYDVSNLPFFELAETLSDVKDKLNETGAVPSDMDLSVTLLQGLSASLDKYSVFMEKESLQRFNERIRGSLSGVGARVQRGDVGALIIEVFPGGPAADGGLKNGDEVTEIDGVSLQGLTLSQITERLRGAVGTTVLVGYNEGGDPEKFDRIELKRAMVRVPNVHWRQLESGVGLIEISSFSEQTTGWLAEALIDLIDARGIILDLRGNSGGSMLQSCLTVDAFLNTGVAVKTVGRDGQPPPRLMREYLLENTDSEPTVPIVVLVNKKTASAAEIVAGSLQLHKRALVIGAQTYGKGLVQMPYTIRSGSAEERVMLKLTIAQYLLKDGYSVHDKNGIFPDITVRPFYFFQNGAYLEPTTTDMIYARESGGWDMASIPDRDFIFDFANLLLSNTEGTELQDLKQSAELLMPELSAQEDQIIHDSMAEREIDWGNSENTSINPEPLLSLRFIEPVSAGQKTTVQVTIVNPSETGWHRVNVYLRTADLSRPWNGQMIPIGYVPPGSSVSGELNINISPTAVSRIDEIFGSVHINNQVVTFPAEKIIVLGEPVMTLDSNLKLNYDPETGNAELKVRLENTGTATIQDIKAHIFWPRDTPVSYFSEEIQVPSLDPGMVTEDTLSFQFVPPINALPDPLVQIHTASLPRFIRTTPSVTKLREGISLSPPLIEGPPIVQAPVGPLSLRIHVEDDGRVQDVVAWLDEQKIGYFNGVSDLDIELDLAEGVHTLRVEAYDDQDLVSSWHRHITGY